MKIRKYTTKTEIQQAVSNEFKKITEQVYAEVSADIVSQFAAVVLWTMATRYGWGKKRLTELVDALKDTSDMMSNPSRLHHRFSPVECISTLKDKYGIDVKEVFKPEVQTQW
jgi:hypothetical protein